MKCMRKVINQLASLGATVPLLFGCGLPGSATQEEGTLVKDTVVDLRCRLAVSNTSARFQRCRCFEVKGGHDTLSEGIYVIDSVDQSSFRIGWHTFFSDSGYVRRHFTLLFDSAGARQEHFDEVVRIGMDGDTIWKESRFVEIRLSRDTVPTNERFTVAMTFIAPTPAKFFQVHAFIGRAGSNVDARSAPMKEYAGKHFTLDTLLNEPGDYELRAYIFGAIETENGDSLEVVKAYCEHPIVVR